MQGLNRLLLILLAFILSVYIVYEHATDANAISLDKQIERHERWMAGDSEFFNPWQYRVFSPMIVEVSVSIYQWVSGQKSSAIPFLIVHFLQMVIIIYLSHCYFTQLGIKNPFVLIAGLLILCYNISLSTYKSDLSFNTYFDIIFYLLAGIIVLKEKYKWVIPLTVVAALNRETSGFIPFMTIVPFTLENQKERIFVFICSLILFGVVFFAVRFYFGFHPAEGIHGLTTPVEHLRYNFSFLKLYPLLLGTLSIIPLIVVFHLKKLNAHLFAWFWLIVPIWVGIHLIKSTVVETRLFLVPQLMIFLPGFLYLLEQWYADQTTMNTRD